MATVIPGDAAGTCWLEISALPDDLARRAAREFDDVFALHPVHRGTIVNLSGGESERARWHQSFFRTPPCPSVADMTMPYMFGARDEVSSGPPPSLFQSLMDHVNATAELPYNQMVVNWYADGSDWMPQHVDWNAGMAPGAAQRIVTISLGGSRVFRVSAKKRLPDDDVALPDGMDIPVAHGTIVTMCGSAFHDKYKHGVPKVPEAGPRISVTLRHYTE